MFTYLMEGFREDGGLVIGLTGNRNKLEHGNSGGGGGANLIRVVKYWKRCPERL